MTRRQKVSWLFLVPLADRHIVRWNYDLDGRPDLLFLDAAGVTVAAAAAPGEAGVEASAGG